MYVLNVICSGDNLGCILSAFFLSLLLPSSDGALLIFAVGGVSCTVKILEFAVGGVSFVVKILEFGGGVLV